MGPLKVIYEPRGRAREYSELACNLFQGCEHGCIYCYVPDVIFKEKADFHANPAPKPGILSKLEKDARTLKATGETRQIHLCFTCDPYQPSDEERKITRQAIEILHFYGLNVKILTKGGLRATRDFDLLTPLDSFGVTLTFRDSDDSLAWEPKAALPGERALSLEQAKKLGIPTWASMEPIVKPEATLELIRAVAPYTDHFGVGKLNYHPLANTIDWRRVAHDTIDLLTELGKSYYIKKDLRHHLQDRLI